MTDQLKPLAQSSLFSGTAFDVVAMAASAGGVEALRLVLSGLPATFPAAVVVVQHRTTQEPNFLPEVLGRKTTLRVKLAEEGEALRPGTVFLAPPGQHLLVKADRTLSLSLAPRVHSVRPSADLLFESVATSFKDRAVAVVLTGADSDGSRGVPIVKKMGGVVVAQDATTAEVWGMPRSAIETGAVDLILPLSQIASTVVSLVTRGRDS